MKKLKIVWAGSNMLPDAAGMFQQAQEFCTALMRIQNTLATHLMQIGQDEYYCERIDIELVKYHASSKGNWNIREYDYTPDAIIVSSVSHPYLGMGLRKLVEVAETMDIPVLYMYEEADRFGWNMFIEVHDALQEFRIEDITEGTGGLAHRLIDRDKACDNAGVDPKQMDPSSIFYKYCAAFAGTQGAYLSEVFEVMNVEDLHDASGMLEWEMSFPFTLEELLKCAKFFEQEFPEAASKVKVVVSPLEKDLHIIQKQLDSLRE